MIFGLPSLSAVALDNSFGKLASTSPFLIFVNLTVTEPG
jgi:hypothetical protein